MTDQRRRNAAVLMAVLAALVVVAATHVRAQLTAEQAAEVERDTTTPLAAWEQWD